MACQDVARLLALVEAKSATTAKSRPRCPFPWLLFRKTDPSSGPTGPSGSASGQRVPVLVGFTEIPVRAWHDEDEAERCWFWNRLQAPAAQCGDRTRRPARHRLACRCRNARVPLGLEEG